MQTALLPYRLDFGSELTCVGAAATTEAGRPGRRYGSEFPNDAKPYKWLPIGVDAAHAHARSRDRAPAAGDHTEGAAAAPVEAVHFHPIESRSLRVTLVRHG